MSRLQVTLVAKNYDYLAPLACGDVVAEGLELKLIRDKKAIDIVLKDPSLDAGEMSISRFLIGMAKGDRSFVALPSFAYRGFVHRCFFVRRDSGLGRLEDLQGKRVGTDAWPATGNTWSRAALRERGVAIDGISWWVGPVEGAPSGRPQGTLPPYARFVSTGQTLREMLLNGELDAVMCSWPPEGFYEPGSKIVRLFPDFRRAEREYYRRTGICPAFHLIRLRRDLFEQHPWVARSLYQALEQSKLLWQQARKFFAETTPWILAEIEEAIALFGEDWWPNGVEANRKMLRTFCEEQYAQGLVPQLVNSNSVFAEFEKAMRG